MFLKMSMFYIRSIIIRSRQRNNLRDTIMKSRDYTRCAAAKRVKGVAGGRGVSVSKEARASIRGRGEKRKTNKSALLILRRDKNKKHIL